MFLEQHIIMISEDTEDCSNDVENTALITEINYSLTDINIENCFFFHYNNISQFPMYF